MMPISAAKISKKLIRTPRGFSLIEILVVLVLMSMVFLFLPESPFDTPHDHLIQSIDDIERAVKFAQDEAVLRNKITRLKVNMDTSPGEYVVEVGPDTPFVVPSFITNPEKSEIKSKEERVKKLKNFNAMFIPVAEFKSMSSKLHDGINIVGASLDTDEKLVKKGEFFLFFYPTGNRDGGFIALASDEEVASVEIPALSPSVLTSFKILKEEKSTEEKVLEDLFRQWQDRN